MQECINTKENEAHLQKLIVYNNKQANLKANYTFKKSFIQL